jgi:hypothetical protein
VTRRSSSSLLLPVLAFAGALVVSFVAGCSPVTLTTVPDGGAPDGGGGGDGGIDAGQPRPDGGLPVEVACDVLNAQRCAYYARCGLIGPGADDTERCVKELVATWCGPSTWPARVDPAVGTLKYDPYGAEDCAASFASRACAEWETLPSSCNTFLKPAANLREACYDGFPECIEGVCRGAACPRTCQQRGVAGEVCRLDSDCVARLFCRKSTTTPGVGTCAPYAGIGEPCDEGTRCLEGLWCHMSQCVQLPPEGQPCFYGQCNDLAYCDAQLDGGTCLGRKSRGTGCAPGQCLPELVCGALTTVCEPRALEMPGVPCTWQQECPQGQACVGWTASAPGTCGPALGEAQACLHHDDCQAHLACLEADGGASCGQRRADGEACRDARECSLESTCAGGRCVPLGEPGQSCAESGACLWGACVDAGTAGIKCAGPLGPGAACRSGADCASGRCEQGACLASCSP